MPCRPITTMSFRWNYHYGGQLEPYWYKATNVLLHALVSALVYSLARVCVLPPLPASPSIFLSSQLPSAVAAALFAAHPGERRRKKQNQKQKRNRRCLLPFCAS